MSTTRTPKYLPGKTVEKSMVAMTSTDKGKLEAIGMFNNCIVKDSKGSWVLIFATSFVCEGIARELGYKVYPALPKYGPNHWVVDTCRDPSITAVNKLALR